MSTKKRSFLIDGNFVKESRLKAGSYNVNLKKKKKKLTKLPRVQLVLIFHIMITPTRVWKR